MTRFIHIADLHHARHTGNAITAERTSFDIQADKLAQLAEVIRRENIKAVLIAGDIEVSDPEDFVPYLKTWTALGASVYLVYGDHDLNRLAYDDCWRQIEHVHSFLHPGYLYDETLGAGIYGLSCETNQAGLKEQFALTPVRDDPYPNIFLSHGDRKQFFTSVVTELGFNYYALGHHHRYESIHRGEANLVYPGHIFSVWDGCGKAWSTGYIIGEVTPSGITHEFRTFEGPETRRISFNSFLRDGSRLLLTRDNLEGPSEQWIEEDETLLRKLIRSTLAAYPDDYFVTPSQSKGYPTRRLSMTGRLLLEDDNRFEEFFARSFKATKTTQ
ncbi:metallophosphoesterase family protein [Exiguobacterium sp. s50]|uniref:metallophosphoesterase family protein n=1 Tax=Exiguobacterium sp. s50 TaxID=2751234 RepID=UPI001BE77377|nr:metallophosphoesterase family protein [Exiguobacterium sp. s50]